jgi:hypothetical protein
LSRCHRLSLTAGAVAGRQTPRMVSAFAVVTRARAGRRIPAPVVIPRFAARTWPGPHLNRRLRFCRELPRTVALFADVGGVVTPRITLAVSSGCCFR